MTEDRCRRPGGGEHAQMLPNAIDRARSEVTNLSNFDDITLYEVSEDVQEQLWVKEVTKLVKVITIDTPLAFKGSQDLAVDSKQSYKILTALADQAWQLMNITSFERFRTLVFLGTSDTSNVNCAWSAFHVLDQVEPTSVRNDNDDDSLSTTHTAEPGSTKIVPGSGKESASTQVSRSYAPNGRGSDNPQATRSAIFKPMSHVITVIIPLIMTSPTAVCLVANFNTMAIFTELDGERQQNLIKPRTYDKYNAFFCLTTEEYVAEQHCRGLDAIDKVSNNTKGGSSRIRA
ncbi:hypothetical protein GQ44DRAFT_780437 [Phaeosphaeriaceae sp. PMI808]|nr:hypothetical protein GQ44DRAFT_780437 [Phaeosphaeriaceae sp. PMI808]